jgi:hypothetical protein
LDSLHQLFVAVLFEEFEIAQEKSEKLKHEFSQKKKERSRLKVKQDEHRASRQ